MIWKHYLEQQPVHIAAQRAREFQETTPALRRKCVETVGGLCIQYFHMLLSGNSYCPETAPLHTTTYIYAFSHDDT